MSTNTMYAKSYYLLGLEIDIGVTYIYEYCKWTLKKKISLVIENKTCFISR